MITGQGNGQGGARAGPEVRPASRRARHRESRAPQVHRRASGACPRSRFRTRGSPRCRWSRRSTTARSRACCSICFNPLVSLPDAELRPRGAGEAGVLRRDRLLPLRDGPPRRHRAARLADGGGRGHDHQRRRPRHPSPKAVRAARPARARTGGSSAISPRGSARATSSPIARRGRSSTSCASRRKGGISDYYGITWEKIDESRASSGPARRWTIPGTPRLYEGGASATPTARRTCSRSSGARPPRSPTTEYPIILTTGRVGGAVPLRHADAPHRRPRRRRRPSRCCEIHPRLAGKLGIADGDFVQVESRRGSPDRAARWWSRPSVPTPSSSPTTGRCDRAANRADHPRHRSRLRYPRVQDLRGAGEQDRATGRRRRAPATAGGRAPVSELAFFIDYSRCIGCRACVQACEECDTHRGRSMIHLEEIERRRQRADRAAGLHALRGPDLRARLPGRRHQADARRRHPELAQAALHRLLQLRAGLPVRGAEVLRRHRPDDEVRHAATTAPASGKRPMCATVCPSQALAFTTLEEIERTRRGSAVNRWVFGGEVVETKVFVVVPAATREVRPDLVQIGERRHEPFDVAALLEEPREGGGSIRRRSPHERRAPLERGLPHPLGRGPLRHAARARQVPHPWFRHHRPRHRGRGRDRRSPAPAGPHAQAPHRRGGAGGAGRLAALPLPHRRGPLHPGPARRRRVGRVLAGLHAPLLRGGPQAGFRAAGLSLSRRPLHCADGRVTAGPPTRRLPRVLLEEGADGIYAVGMEV